MPSSRSSRTPRSRAPAAPGRSTASAPPRSSQAVEDLRLLVCSRYGLLHLETSDTDRATSVLQQLATVLGLPYFEWTASAGLRRSGARGSVYGTEDPRQALGHIQQARFGAVYALRGLEAYFGDVAFVALLEDVARACENQPGALVLVGTGFELPQRLQAHSARVTLPPPSEAELDALVDRVRHDLGARMAVREAWTPEERRRFVRNLSGLTLAEAERVVTRAIVEDGALSAADLEMAQRIKKERVEHDGLLQFYPADHTMADVVGFAALKSWLRERRVLVDDPEAAARYGLAFPKGMLLLGVPGCGKSLCAKAVAREWALPLVRLDPGRLYDKYVGESERNFARALQQAEDLAPVVLWIDELEKAFAPAGGEADGGASQRIFGSFLAWMQERRAPVFVVATANDIQALPPEFLRKGRFDEVFFVDLPGEAARRAILELHLRRRRLDPGAFDVAALAARTEGWSGAELEQAVVAAVFRAVAERREPATVDLEREIDATQPLARTLGERIHALRAWARGRVRRAD